jgi:hypothetical protein
MPLISPALTHAFAGNSVDVDDEEEESEAEEEDVAHEGKWRLGWKKSDARGTNDRV